MNYPDRYAIILDGAFVVKKMTKQLGRFPESADVVDLCTKIRKDVLLKGLKLLRIYFYHALPAEKQLVNPIDNSILDLATSPTFTNNYNLLDTLEMQPDFALRLGEVITRGWSLGAFQMKNLIKKQRALKADDLVPNIMQKGVDLRIGLDIARLSLQRLVSEVVVVTGDSDFIPAFKFARREGLRVYLAHMGHQVKRDLIAHTDAVINV